MANNTYYFNTVANTELEKALQGHELTADERQAADTAISRQLGQEKAEIEAFNDPDEFNRRLEDKLAEIAQNPAPELRPGGGPPQNVAPHQLLQQADGLVRRDHDAKLQGYVHERDAAVNAVLEQAREDGRGRPAQESDQAQEQDRDPNRDR